MAKGERVIVYGLRGDRAQYNSRFAFVMSYDTHRNVFTVAFVDGSTVAVQAQNLFFTSKAVQYFDKPYYNMPSITEFTRVQKDADGRKSIVATKPIPAGTLLATHSFRVEMTRQEINDVEAEFKEFMCTQLFTLMGRPSDLSKIVFERNYNRSIVFIGAVAKRGVLGHPIIQTVMAYDSTSDECLTREWPRLNGADLLWYEFFRQKLTHLTSVQVWHLFHLVRNFPWPSADRLSLVFGETICLMECHPKRVLEYQKVVDGKQNQSDDNLAHEYLSTFMMTPPEGGDRIKAYFMQDVEVGDPIRTDCGLTYVASLCDTIFGMLFMPQQDADEWFTLYRKILTNVSVEVARHFLNYFKDNFARVKKLQKEMPATVRKTPSVHALRAPPASPPASAPALPLCDNKTCRKPMHAGYTCADCRTARYCGEECQAAAWKKHSRKCKHAAA